MGFDKAPHDFLIVRIVTLLSAHFRTLPDKGGLVMNSQKLPQNLRLTQVVTCILLRIDQAETRMLLVRRSQKVGSYHGHWAGVSGFVGPNITPDEQAYTEIREE